LRRQQAGRSFKEFAGSNGAISEKLNSVASNDTRTRRVFQIKLLYYPGVEGGNRRGKLSHVRRRPVILL
jgi:hypothetical protein